MARSSSAFVNCFSSPFGPRSLLSSYPSAARLAPHPARSSLLPFRSPYSRRTLLTQNVLYPHCHSRRAEEIASRVYDIPDSKRRAVSVDTLLDWASSYRKGSFEALAPKPRQDRGQSRTITPQLSALIERLKRENPHRTGTTLLRELALCSDTDEPPVSASTLYRFLKQRGLSEKALLSSNTHKKFEAQFSNQIWQADMLFGPWVQRLGGGRRQVFLHATLDDASRLVPHAQFYSSQALDAVLDCLRQAIAARGVPTKLYIDNARMYRSPQLARIVSVLLLVCPVSDLVHAIDI